MWRAALQTAAREDRRRHRRKLTRAAGASETAMRWAAPRVGTKLVPIGPQRLGLFGRLYPALRNTKYGRLLLELMTRTLGCLILAGLQHPGPLRGPPTAGPTLAMTNLPHCPLSHECTCTVPLNGLNFVGNRVIQYNAHSPKVIL